ncbi:MAG: TIGR03086 family protein [Nitriliruptorales bacterium]|nr:TIGR03086 family protein [Nitriliruptorales bacterium]
MNIPELHRRAVEGFGQRVRAIDDDQWHLPTPCAGWDVRQLVAHLVDENLWTPWLFDGHTIAEAGDRFSGDPVGDDPKQVWEEHSPEAVGAVHQDGAMERTVHLSFGDVPGEEYASQLFADHLIHSWDLARGIGADEKLDPELIAACAEWFAAREDIYRDGGAIGARPDVPANADPQTILLAAFGRTP